VVGKGPGAADVQDRPTDISQHVWEERYAWPRNSRHPIHRFFSERCVVGAARDLPIDDADAWDGPAAAKRMLDEAGFDGYRKRLGDL
jgi:hypothetical protein